MPTEAKMQPQQQRVIRVFISSTFRDMQMERDELVKRTFPQLRRLCESRGGVWGEVDLRWGLTDEEAAEGQILPVCLEEIDRCRPFFIGLLGERYGWVPENIPEDVIEKEPWLARHRNRSVTELEMMHAALNGAPAPHAFFYFRDPAYLASLPPDVQMAYREERQNNRTNLIALKERIRACGLPVRENYANPEQLAEIVLRDFTEVINRILPGDPKLDLLARESLDQECFGASRRRVYIGGTNYFDRLDAHAAGKGLPLIVTGESGSGKSSLLANWVQHYREQPNPDIPSLPPSTWSRIRGLWTSDLPSRTQGMVIIEHYIGATSESGNWAFMLRRILGEFNRQLSLGLTIPREDARLRPAFAEALQVAGRKTRCILLLDNLNQLDDREGASDLIWLPNTIPENIRLIASTQSGSAFDALNKRAWPTLIVEPLKPDERIELISKYLRIFYAKGLSDARAHRIADSPQAGNPLFLRTLLEELRLFGSHDLLDERINHYLEAKTVPALYQMLLSRYETDYERHWPGLVRDTMCAIWGARRGLTELELLELLGRAGNPLPRAHFSPLYLAAESSLVNRNGFIGFSHEHMGTAVEQRYLTSDVAKRDAHHVLGNHFRDCGNPARRAEEAPWQFLNGEEWKELECMLRDLPFLTAAWKLHEVDVRRYWHELEQHGFSMNRTYHEALTSPQHHGESDLWTLAALLGDTYLAQKGEDLWGHLSARYRKNGDVLNQATCLGNQAHVLKDRGDLEGALALFREQELLCRKPPNAHVLAASLGGQASILRMHGQEKAALSLLERAERIFRTIDDSDSRRGVAACLGNRASILQDAGETQTALSLLNEAELILKELGDLDALATCAQKRAALLYDTGLKQEALALVIQQNRFYESIGDLQGQANTWMDFATTIRDAEPEKALEWFKNAESILDRLGDRINVQRCLGQQATLLYSSDPSAALRCSRRQEEICRQLNLPDDLAAALATQAALLADHFRRPAEALPIAEEAQRLARKLGHKRLVVSAENILALVRQQLKN